MSDSFDLVCLTREARIKVWATKKIYIPEYVKGCEQHLTNGRLPAHIVDGLRYINRPINIPGDELRLFLYDMGKQLAHENTRLLIENDANLVHKINDVLTKKVPMACA